MGDPLKAMNTIQYVYYHIEACIPLFSTISLYILYIY